MALGQDRILIPRRKRTHRVITLQDHLGMLRPSTAFGVVQDVLPVHFHHVRTLNPDRLFTDIYSSIYNDLGFPGRLVGFKIVRTNPDGAVPLVEWFTFGRIIIQDIGGPVIIEKERGVNAAHTVQPHRVGPISGRIVSRNNETATDTKYVIYHIKCTIMILDSWGKHTIRDPHTLHL